MTALDSTFETESIAQYFRRYPVRFLRAWRGKVSRYTPMHDHPCIELVHHPRGAGVTSLESGEEIEFHAHDTIFYPHGLKHDQQMQIEGEDICIHLVETAPHDESAPFLKAALHIAPSDHVLRGGRYIHREFMALTTERATPARQTELDFRATALLLRLLNLRNSTALSTRRSPQETYLDRTYQYINRHYAKITSVSEIAEHAGVSEDYLRHLLQERKGINLTRLLNEIRISRAKEYLHHTQLPLKQIAELTGFKTERYLATRFKELTGMTPGESRRAMTAFR